MDARKILAKYYPENSLAASFLLPHSEAVASLAVAIGKKIPSVDLTFLEDAALLHDIGIFLTKAPSIGCEGDSPYITHGIHGEQLLNDLGYPQHAQVCRTHIGVSLTASYITKNGLPLPPEDMIPVTEEERIIAYSDKFFSKRKEWLTTPKPVDIVLDEMRRFGTEPVETFLKWHEKYEF